MRAGKKFSPCKIVKQFQRKSFVSHELFNTFINNCGKQGFCNKDKGLQHVTASEIMEILHALSKRSPFAMVKGSRRFL